MGPRGIVEDLEYFARDGEIGDQKESKIDTWNIADNRQAKEKTNSTDFENQNLINPQTVVKSNLDLPRGYLDDPT